MSNVLAGHTQGNVQGEFVHWNLTVSREFDKSAIANGRRSRSDALTSRKSPLKASCRPMTFDRFYAAVVVFA